MTKLEIEQYKKQLKKGIPEGKIKNEKNNTQFNILYSQLIKII
jgi:hypothetical protein